jgi:hypothetical protein
MAGLQSKVLDACPLVVEAKRDGKGRERIRELMEEGGVYNRKGQAMRSRAPEMSCSANRTRGVGQGQTNR